MKLTELLMVTCYVIVVVAGSDSGGEKSAEKSDEKSAEKSGDRALLELALAQLERLDAYRLNKGNVDRIDKSSQEISTSTVATAKSKLPLKDTKDQQMPAGVYQLLSGEDLQKLIEMTKKIDKNRVVIELMTDPKYAAMLQERNKRGSSDSGGSASILSGIASGLIGGISSASKGSSSSSSSSSSGSSHPGYDYGPPQPYGHKTFDIWDFKKAIFNTLFQAIKAIGGGVIALKGHLIKGGGYLVSATGRVISKTGEATTSLGKNIAASAVISPPKEQYGPPGYTYNAPTVEYTGHDSSYDGPPPSASDYTVPGTGYDNGNSGYASPSDDDDHSGILHVGLTIPTKSETAAAENNEHQPDLSHGQQHLADLENSFGGLTNVKQQKIKVLLSSIPASSNSPPHAQENHVENYQSYGHTNVEPPEHKYNQQSLPQTYEQLPSKEPNPAHHDHYQHHNDHLTIQQSLEYPPIHVQQVQTPAAQPWPLDLAGHSSQSGGVDFYTDLQIDVGPQFSELPNFAHHAAVDLPAIKPHVGFHNMPGYSSVHVAPFRIPMVGPVSHQLWQGNSLHGYGHVVRRRKTGRYKRRYVRAIDLGREGHSVRRELALRR